MAHSTAESDGPHRHATDLISTWIVSEKNVIDLFGFRRSVSEHAADCVRRGNVASLSDVILHGLYYQSSGTGAHAESGRVRSALEDLNCDGALEWCRDGSEMGDLSLVDLQEVADAVASTRTG